MKTGGFTLVETLIVVAIFVFIAGSIFAVFSMGRSSWYQAELSIDLQQNMRRAMNRIIRELHESGCEDVNSPDGCESNEYKLDTSNPNILKFSMYLDCSGTKRWQVPLRWACRDSSCIDQDGDCASVEYSEVEYLVNSSRQLTRRVLDAIGALLREDVIANNIQNFQAARNGDIVTIQISVEATDVFGRQLAYTLSNQAYLRNLFK